MSPKVRSRIAAIALILAGLSFLDATSLLCYCPLEFILPGVSSLLAAVLGSRPIRIIGILLCAASLAMGIHHYERKTHIDAILRAAQQKALTNSDNK